VLELTQCPNAERIGEILDTLVSLGRGRELDDGRFVIN